MMVFGLAAASLCLTSPHITPRCPSPRSCVDAASAAIPPERLADAWQRDEKVRWVQSKARALRCTASGGSLAARTAQVFGRWQRTYHDTTLEPRSSVFARTWCSGTAPSLLLCAQAKELGEKLKGCSLYLVGVGPKKTAVGRVRSIPSRLVRAACATPHILFEHQI